VKFSYPIQRAFFINSENKLEFLYPEYRKNRSQDLLPTYHDAGQFYWCNINKFLESGSLLTTKTGYLKLSELEVQDIDNEEDWKIAEVKLNQQLINYK